MGFNATELLLIACATQMTCYSLAWAIVSVALDSDRATTRCFTLYNALIASAFVLAVSRVRGAHLLFDVLPDLLMLLGIVIVVYGIHKFWQRETPKSVYVAAALAAMVVCWAGIVFRDDGARVTASAIGFCVMVGLAMWGTYRPTRREFGAVASNGLSAIVILLVLSLAWRIYLSLFTNESPSINQPSSGSELAMFAVLFAGFTPNLLYAYFVAARLVRRANNAARTDGLTGLFNHRAFMDEADRLWAARKKRNVKGVALAIDLDFFKRINDVYGHATGDEVLRTFAQILSSVCAGDCIAGRTGGEEFVMVIAPANKDIADKVAERLMRRVRRARWQSEDGVEIKLTVSVGIAFDSPTDLRPNDLLSRADAALYRAKESGRDRVVYA
jgi:diguanylate cyclase (GGDEF)-like protein